MRNIEIAVIDYPDSLKSAVYGLSEMFTMANRISLEQSLSYQFTPYIVQCNAQQLLEEKVFDVVLLPPSLASDFYLSPSALLIQWLNKQASLGAILCSACAGAFILGSAGLLAGKQVTTHWALAERFCEKFPELDLHIDKILINEGNIITAGGMMAWLDLGFSVLAKFTQQSIVGRLGKYLVTDTGQREQRFYQQFIPILNHGDALIGSVQKMLGDTFAQAQSISELARQCCLSERTFLRRFVKATKLKPTQYIQHLRIQKACDLLESTNHSFDWIAQQVGYEDPGACRKLLIRMVGLSPSEFRKRFITHNCREDCSVT